MSRIRSIKPEWLDDERIALASSNARVLSIGLLLMADDYGNGRAGKLVLSGRVFPGAPVQVLEDALAELVKLMFVELYESGNQHYFHIRNWSKHQKVDKPGKPTVPSPGQVESEVSPEDGSDLVYFAQEQNSGNIKIGRSWNPRDRVRKLKTGSPSPIELIGTIEGGWREREIHGEFADDRLSNDSEWFRPSERLLAFIREHSRNAEKIRASRASLPFPSYPDPGPDPIPVQVRREESATNLDQALALPIQERAQSVVSSPHIATWVEPQRWPEVVELAAAWGAARMGLYAQDAGVRACVALFAAGYSLDELKRAAATIKASPWAKRKQGEGSRLGMSSMTPESVRRALDESKSDDPTAGMTFEERISYQQQAAAQKRRDEEREARLAEKRIANGGDHAVSKLR